MAQEVKRTLVVSKESVFGTKPAKTGAKIIPRIETSLNANFESFQSEEIRSDLQRSASMIGFEKVEGDIKGELAAGQWSQFFAAVLRGAFTAEAKAPIIKKTSNGTGEKNGKILIVPEANHTSDSFTIEEVFQDIGVNRLYTGCRISKMSIDVQPNGISSVTVSFLGQKSEELQATYFTNPTPIAQSGKLAGVKGQLLLNKAQVGFVTSFKVDIDLGASSEAVLGATYAPDVFIGTVKVSGSFSTYLQNRSMWQAVRNGTSLSLALRMDAESEPNSDYVTLILPGVKLTSSEVSSGDNLIQTLNFDAFPAVYDATSTIDDSLKKATTMIVQDTLA
ncbi:phage tail tube protein [Actinobacillus porcinus]|uniref:phage tail tube protein n=1 Tax=Actinobacillus porcinus TaxID=51048 RepID=UPI0023F574CB|nr:phage tail tube protein [Actinobacillus porcinus]MDD7545574.1 phage tail tube protein [Actinobacillus porcinus]MDY5847633.1 phage tail tube protein [Actinobacillus porcinus]